LYLIVLAINLLEFARILKNGTGHGIEPLSLAFSFSLSLSLSLSVTNSSDRRRRGSIFPKAFIARTSISRNEVSPSPPTVDWLSTGFRRSRLVIPPNPRAARALNYSLRTSSASNAFIIAHTLPTDDRRHLIVLFRNESAYPRRTRTYTRRRRCAQTAGLTNWRHSRALMSSGPN